MLARKFTAASKTNYLLLSVENYFATNPNEDPLIYKIFKLVLFFNFVVCVSQEKLITRLLNYTDTLLRFGL